MANLPQPEEHIVFELAAIRQKFMRKAMEDQVLDAKERRFLERIDNLKAFTGDVKARRHLASHIERGGSPTAYMNRIAEPIGMKVVSLDDERSARNVVRFPGSEPSIG